MEALAGVQSGRLSRNGSTAASFSAIPLGDEPQGLAFKLLEAAPGRWRAVNGPHLVALVRAGARFDKGVMVERPDEVQEVAA